MIDIIEEIPEQKYRNFHHNGEYYYHYSELCRLKKDLEPDFIKSHNPTDAFAYGTLLDMMLTEQDKLKKEFKKVDGGYIVDSIIRFDDNSKHYLFPPLLFKQIKNQYLLLMDEPFFKKYLKCAKGQHISTTRLFGLPFIRKYDLYINQQMAWDIKTTKATTEYQFMKSIDSFNYDIQRYVYGTELFGFKAISKVNNKIFTVISMEGDEIWQRGKEKTRKLCEIIKMWMV